MYRDKGGLDLACGPPFADPCFASFESHVNLMRQVLATLHFNLEETEAQRRETICPRHTASKCQSCGLSPALPEAAVWALALC